MMPEPLETDLAASILSTWRTSNQVTVYLVESIPPALWPMEIPGVPRRTIRAVAAHLHNARCRWIRTLGRDVGIPVPVRVDHHAVTRRQLVTALMRSSRGMEALLRLAFESGGTMPAAKGYVWKNLQLDAGHVMGYFVAHEGHHRGQIIMAARQLGKPFPLSVIGGVWHWIARAKEV